MQNVLKHVSDFITRIPEKPNSQLDLGDSVPKSGNQKMSKSTTTTTTV